jgi:hypothetical protein
MIEHDLMRRTFYWRKKAEEYLRFSNDGPDPARAERLAKLAAAYTAAMDEGESTSRSAVKK